MSLKSVPKTPARPFNEKVRSPKQLTSRLRISALNTTKGIINIFLPDVLPRCKDTQCFRSKARQTEAGKLENQKQANQSF